MDPGPGSDPALLPALPLPSLQPGTKEQSSLGWSLSVAYFPSWQRALYASCPHLLVAGKLRHSTVPCQGLTPQQSLLAWRNEAASPQDWHGQPKGNPNPLPVAALWQSRAGTFPGTRLAVALLSSVVLCPSSQRLRVGQIRVAQHCLTLAPSPAQPAMAGCRV